MDQDEKLLKLLTLLATDMQTIQNSMQSIQRDLRGLHGYTLSTDEEVRKLRSEFNASMGEIKELSGRISIVENQIAENTEAVRKSALSEEALRSDMNEIMAANEQAKDTLDDAARIIRAAGSDISKVGTEVVFIQQEMEKFGHADETIINSLSILRTELETIRAELQTTTLDTFSIKEQLEKIVAYTDSTKGTVQEDLDMVIAMDAKVSEYSARFAEILEEVKKNREGFPPLDQHILEVSTTLGNLISDLDRIDERVEKHADRTELSIQLLEEQRTASASLRSALRSID